MIAPLTLTRLRKAAVDNGFDVELPQLDEWLCFISTKAPLKIWLSARNGSSLSVALSQSSVARELRDDVRSETNTTDGPVPAGAVERIEVSNFDKLHQLLRRAFQLSRSLPYVPLREFEDKTAGMPRSTEAERLVVQRVGQDVYRQSLIEYWEGKCAISGLDVVELLRASHSKPWADCADDYERLDAFNGFLLAPHLDALFDQGFITIADDRVVVMSLALPNVALSALGIDLPMQVARLTDTHRKYLLWHRAHVYKH